MTHQLINIMTNYFDEIFVSDSRLNLKRKVTPRRLIVYFQEKGNEEAKGGLVIPSIFKSPSVSFKRDLAHAILTVSARHFFLLPSISPWVGLARPPCLPTSTNAAKASFQSSKNHYQTGFP